MSIHCLWMIGSPQLTPWNPELAKFTPIFTCKMSENHLIFTYNMSLCTMSWEISFKSSLFIAVMKFFSIYVIVVVGIGVQFNEISQYIG